MNLSDHINDALGTNLPAQPETSFPVHDIDGDDMVNGMMIRRDGDKIHVGYITHDDEQRDFWNDSEGLGELRAFSRDVDPNTILADLTEKGIPYLLVERYSHGLDHYSVANTASYPDRQWDVGLYGVFIPCEEVQGMYKDKVAEMGEDGARAWLIKDTNGTLSDYSKCVNGDVYGVVVETWSLDGDRITRDEVESVWGHIGSEHALEALSEMMPDAEQEPSPEI